MTDKIRTRLAVLFCVSAFVLPPQIFAIGSMGWGLRTGAVAALATSVACFLLAGFLLATVQDLSWFAVGLPFSAGVLYTVLPDFLVGPFDDAAVLAAGALVTSGLWLRKQPDAPKWLVFPLVFSGVYTLFGGVIPGPVDELLVAAIGTGAAALGASRQLPSGHMTHTEEGDDLIDGEFTVQEE